MLEQDDLQPILLFNRSTI